MRCRSLSLLVAFALMAGCGFARAETIPVTMKGIGFSPARIQAKIGDTIEWTNEDFVVHSATAKNGAWDLNVAPHKKARQVVDKVGAFDYYCRYHPNMKGLITVTSK